MFQRRACGSGSPDLASTVRPRSSMLESCVLGLGHDPGRRCDAHRRAARPPIAPRAHRDPQGRELSIQGQTQSRDDDIRQEVPRRLADPRSACAQSHRKGGQLYFGDRNGKGVNFQSASATRPMVERAGDCSKGDFGSLDVDIAHTGSVGVMRRCSVVEQGRFSDNQCDAVNGLGT